MKKLLLFLLMFFSVVFAETAWKSGGGCIYNTNTSTFVKASDLITDSGNYISKEYLFNSSSVNPICKSAENAYYKINYDPNYGSSNVVQSGNLDYGVAYTLPKNTFTRTGYTLDFWCDKYDCSNRYYATSITGACGYQGCEIDLYAHWKVNTYTLTYNANGGSVSPANKSVDYGSTYGTLPTPARDGYIFQGWYTSSNGGTQIASSTIMNDSDVTIYAQWVEKPKVATFNYNGGIQTYTVPLSGTYKLEVWGAEGGIAGGKGGYSSGNVWLPKGTVLYVVCGGAGGSETSGGYNGGGYGDSDNWGGRNAGMGGGATHIAKVSGTLASIGKSSFNSNGLIVAGGGGGGIQRSYGTGNDRFSGGAGGGSSGSNGVDPWGGSSYGTGGSQSSGGSYSGSFGQGGSWRSGGDCRGGGGGGYYGGGYGRDDYRTGGGGSGWIGGVSNGSMQNGVRSGNGYAQISYIA